MPNLNNVDAKLAASKAAAAPLAKRPPGAQQSFVEAVAQRTSGAAPFGKRAAAAPFGKAAAALFGKAAAAAPFGQGAAAAAPDRTKTFGQGAAAAAAAVPLESIRVPPLESIRVPPHPASELKSTSTPTGAPSGQTRGRASSVNSKGRSRSPSPSGKTQARTTLLLQAVDTSKIAGGNYSERALRHGACTDSWHDFHKEAYNETNLAQNGTFGLFDTLQGLPKIADPQYPVSTKNSGNPDSLHDENEIMIELFSGFELLSGVDLKTYNLSKECHPNFFMDTLIRKLVENLENNHAEPTHTFKSLDGDNLYNIKLLHKKLGAEDAKYGYAKTNVPSLVKADRLDTDEIYNFFGTSDINLLFDASVIDVLGVIRNCNQGTKALKVNRIINRELINDPAPKTYELKKEVRPNAAANVEANILFDDETEPVVYSEYETPRELNRNKFYSIFNFNLGRLKYTTKSLPTISLDIKDSTGNVVHFDDNPHAGNEISHCWERMTSIAEKSPSKHYDASIHFQCKRSGDWLQALSCFDTGRKYVNYDGKKRTNPKPFIVQGDKIILVTHDRVLLYYAILMGLDVIMTYKIPPTNEARQQYKAHLEQKAAAAGGGGAGGGVSLDEEDDDDDGSKEVDYDDHHGRSNKYILYFQNSKRLGGYVTPAPAPVDAAAVAALAAEEKNRINGQLIDKKNSIMPVAFAATVDKIKAYNVDVNTIINQNEAEIIDINADVHAASTAQGTAKIVAQASASASLVQSYLKLSCANYKCIDAAKYSKLANDVNDITLVMMNNEENVAKVKEFISLHDNLSAKLAQLDSKEKIEQLHGNYKKCPQYKNLVNLGCLTKTAWGGRRGVDKSAETNVIEIGTYFIQNLHQRHLKNLVYDLQFAANIIGQECLLTRLLVFIRTTCPAQINLNSLYNQAGHLIPENRANAVEDRCAADAIALGQAKHALASATTAEAKADIRDRISILNGAPVPVKFDVDGDNTKIIKTMIDSGVITDVYRAVIEEKLIVSEIDKRTAVFEQKCAVSDAGIVYPPLNSIANLSRIEAENRNFYKSISLLPVDRHALERYITPTEATLIRSIEYYSDLLNDDVLTYNFYINKSNDDKSKDEFLGLKKEDEEEVGEDDPSYYDDGLEISENERVADEYKIVVDAIYSDVRNRPMPVFMLKYILTSKFLYNKALNDYYNDEDGLTKQKVRRIMRNIYNDKMILDWVRIADSEKLMNVTRVDSDLITRLNTDAEDGNGEKSIGTQSRKPIVTVLNIEGGHPNPLNLDSVILYASTAESKHYTGMEISKETYIHTTIDKTMELIGQNLYTACGLSVSGLQFRNNHRSASEQQKGGGNKENMLVISHIFIIFYLRRLMYDLRGFEKSGNEDYKYYETLACLVISVCGDYNRRDSEFYNKLQAILFDTIPEYDLVVDGTDDDYIIRGRGHAANVQFIGRQVALQCCGYSTGEIVALGNIGVIDASVKTNYIMLRNKLCDLPYGARKSTLISLLSRRIVDYKPPTVSSSGISAANFTAAFSKPRKTSGLPPNRTNYIYKHNKPNSGPAVASTVKVTSGGRKTRKLKKRKNNTKAVTRVNRRTRSRQ